MNKEQIEYLLKRYLDGETTNEEEQQLRQYFATLQIIPPEWKAYKALFGWEDRLQQSAISANAASAPIARKRRLFIAASIAALIVIGVGFTAPLLHSSHVEQQSAKNYAILDGRYTTDEVIIAHEVEEALLMASASDEDTFGAIDFLDIP